MADKLIEGILKMVHPRVLVWGLSHHMWGNELLAGGPALLVLF